MNEVAAVSFVWIVLVFGLLLRSWLTRKVDILSFHTFFMFGMVIFFFVPLALMPWVGYPQGVYDPAGHGWTMLAILISPFMIIYLIFNKVGSKWASFEKIVPPMRFPQTSLGLLMCLGVIIFIGVVSFALPGTGAYSELLVLEFRPGLGAVAAGLSTILLMSNKKNPFYWMLFFGVVVGGILLATVTGADRRFPLSVILASAWAAYYFWLRYQPLAKIAAVMAILGTVAFLFVIVYSSFRHQLTVQGATIQARSQQWVNFAENATNVFSARDLAGLFIQDAPLNSCFIIENYPSQYALLPFNGLLSFLTLPIPRAIWEGKPPGLGELIQEQTHAQGNLAPGIIGTGWAEMTYFGVVFYAVWFGTFTGVADRILRSRATNPYFIVAMGASLANIFGLPRGGTFQFFAQWFTIFSVSTILFYTVSAMFRGIMAGSKPLDFGLPEVNSAPQDDLVDPDAYDDYDPQLAAAYAQSEPDPAPENRAP